MWLGLTKRRLPVGYLTEYLENSVERLTIFGTHFFDSCSMTSELQRTILTIILHGDNTLDPGEKRRTN